eukprot:Gb_17065 [translate_table: standard]
MATACEGDRGEKLEFWPDSSNYARLLQGCVKRKLLAEGKEIHAQLLKIGFEHNTFLANTLVNMYAKCGSVANARQVFDKMTERNLVSWNSMIAGYVQHGDGEEAVQLFCQIQVEGLKKMDQFTFASVFRACASLAAIEQGKQVHAGVIKIGFETDVFVGSALVDFYAKCMSIEDAHKGFSAIPKRDVVVWNTMIGGYAQNDHAEEAVKIFNQMKWAGFQPNQFSLSSILRACTSVEAVGVGKQVHVHIIKTRFECDAFVGSALVDMYAKCGNIKDAREVFNKMPTGDIFSWNALSAGYVLQGHTKEAFQLFEQMQQAGTKANQYIFTSVLSACASNAALEQGQQVHAQIIKTGFEEDVSSGTALVSMYAKCRFIEDASTIFDNQPKQDIVLWNAMIAGYAQNECGKEALKLFDQMQHKSIEMNQITFVSVLNACFIPEDLQQGNQIHACIIKAGFELNVFLGSALVDMYAKCGNLENARKVFDSMLVQDVVSWTGMIAGYAQNGNAEEALKLFSQLQWADTELDQIIFVSVLIACSNLAIIEQGKQVHAHTIKSEMNSSVAVGSALVDMYAKCGNIENACKIFNKMPERNTVSWNVMIARYAQYGLGGEALKLFSYMQRACIELDQFAITGVLRACASALNLRQGKQVHTHIIRTGFESDVFVGSALLDMYAKGGSLDDAYKVFYKLPERNLVSWNAMIAGYVQHDHGEEALKLFCQMQQQGMDSDQFSFASVLKACSSLAALEQGKQVHAHICKTEFDSDVFVGSSLVDMYAKCGSIEDARNKFKKMPKRDVVSWNAMIAGYAQHGQGMEALQAFEKMQEAGMKPNHITFISVLSSCSHVGLVDEGLHFFDSMSQDHGIVPSVEHYACIVDILGRAGHLDEAKSTIDKMPFEPNAVLLRTLLGACRVHGNMELGKYAGEYLMELEPQNSATYVLLSSIYAEAGMWDDVAKVRKMMKDRGVRKEPGFSWIEVNNGVHGFIAEDRSHPQTKQIYAISRRSNLSATIVRNLPLLLDFSAHPMEHLS